MKTFGEATAESLTSRNVFPQGLRAAAKDDPHHEVPLTAPGPETPAL